MNQGQKELEKHWMRIYPHQENDFRSASITRLITGMVESGTILDVGCGTGLLSLKLLQNEFDVTAQDISLEMVERCKKLFRHAGYDPERVRLASVQELTEENAYDNIIALDMIEHIKDDLSALKVMRRALKPGGKLILSVPSLSWLYGLKDEQVGHYRRYDRAVLEEVIKKSGLKIVGIRYWNIIGVIPLCFSVKVLKKRIPEDFRYLDGHCLPKMLNNVLRRWFFFVENPLSMPIGITLIASTMKSD
jgi:SAM-dependent methyltransferase